MCQPRDCLLSYNFRLFEVKEVSDAGNDFGLERPREITLLTRSRLRQHATVLRADEVERRRPKRLPTAAAVDPA